MDHEQAVESRAVERYLLRAMSADERDRFEEHYFSCVACADGVRTGARFDGYAREILSAPGAAPMAISAREGWRSWLRIPSLVPALASIALLGVVIYQRTNPGIDGAEPVAVVALRTATRGDADVARIPSGFRYFTVYFDVPAGAASYECAIADAAGKVITTVAAPAPRHPEPLNLLLKRSDFPRGQYTITVRGDTLSAPLHLKFQIE